VAFEKVKRYIILNYWGKPNPSYGDPNAQLLLVGLAPAAHGGNRTGRMFTGDRSGDWLYRALYKAGFANQPVSISRYDGLKLTNCYITATCRCAPPLNKLLPTEIRNCRPYMLKELQLLKNIIVVIGLGKVGFDSVVESYRQLGLIELNNRPKFSHGAEYKLNNHTMLIGSFHPSQQNTFTGRLTETMFDSIFRRVRKILGKE
jgi:uracil-DNA glycosylase family 4